MVERENRQLWYLVGYGNPSCTGPVVFAHTGMGGGCYNLPAPAASALFAWPPQGPDPDYGDSIWGSPWRDCNSAPSKEQRGVDANVTVPLADALVTDKHPNLAARDLVHHCLKVSVPGFRSVHVTVLKS